MNRRAPSPETGDPPTLPHISLHCPMLHCWHRLVPPQRFWQLPELPACPQEAWVAAVWNAEIPVVWRTLRLGELMEGSSQPGETQVLCTWERSPVSRGRPAEWSRVTILRDSCQIISPAPDSTQHLFAHPRGKILLATCLAFQWDVGSNRAQQLGTLGKQAKTQGSWALGAACFRSIMATWVCLA